MFQVELDYQKITYKHLTFSGGEEHVAIDKPGIPTHELGLATIRADIRSSTNLVELLLLVDAIKRLPIYSVSTKIELLIPYFPYARQDRVCNPRDSFSLGVVAELINGLGANRVTVWDPHSTVTEALVKNIRVVPQEKVVHEYLAWYIRLNDVVLVAPDAGAIKKTEALSKLMGGVPVVYAHKERDTATGAILGIKVLNPDLIAGRNLLVVDDICDGGRTFVELAKAISAYSPKSLDLFVTHGIFSQGTAVLKEHYNSIYSANVWWNNITADGLPHEVNETTPKGFVA